MVQIVIPWSISTVYLRFVERQIMQIPYFIVVRFNVTPDFHYSNLAVCNPIIRLPYSAFSPNTWMKSLGKVTSQSFCLATPILL